MKETRVILSSEAEEVYKYLNANINSKSERMIFDALNKKIQLIKANYHYGEPIAKKLIPKEYKEKYKVTNLFWVGLPSFWRMLYTLSNDNSKIEIVAFVLDVFDHDKYNKKLGYKKK